MISLPRITTGEREGEEDRERERKREVVRSWRSCDERDGEGSWERDWLSATAATAAAAATRVRAGPGGVYINTYKRRVNPGATPVPRILEVRVCVWLKMRP